MNREIIKDEALFIVTFLINNKDNVIWSFYLDEGLNPLITLTYSDGSSNSIYLKELSSVLTAHDLLSRIDYIFGKFLIVN